MRHKQSPQIDPDNLNSLILSIIVKSEYVNIPIDLEIIRNYSIRNRLNCISGYYLDMLCAPVELIESMSVER